MPKDPFEYDVALSFAKEDRAIAEELANILSSRSMSILRDEYTPAEVWGKDLVNHLVNLYSRKAIYCLLLISQHYPLKRWTEEDRMAAQERALRDANEYILLLQLDHTEAAGISEAAGYIDLHQQSLQDIADRLEEKLANTSRSSGPPSESHDLRSGNVPPAHSRSNEG